MSVQTVAAVLTSLSQRLIVVAGLLMVIAGPARAAELTLLTHPLPPFTVGSAAAPSGLAVDIVRGIERRTGDTGEIQIVPYPRLLRDVQLGPSVVGFIVARTPAREALMQWVGPIVVTGVYLYKKAGAAITLRTLADARQLGRIGVTRGDADAKFLSGLGFNNLDYSESQAADLRKVQLGRLDATPMGAIVFANIAVEAGLKPSDFERTAVKLYDSQVYLALSPDVPQSLVRSWSAALAAMKAGGEYAALLARYGVDVAEASAAPRDGS